MKYGFDILTERRGSGSVKWDVSEGELPMWIADMDFEVAPPIKAAIMKQAEHGIFGYSEVPAAYFEAFRGFWKRRHGVDLDTEWMVYSSGIVAAISSAVRKLTTPNENVLVMAPVYNIFYNSIVNNGRRVLSSDLVYENGTYRVDFSDLEKKLSDPQTSLMIFCNPHNPVGKIWSREEICRVGELCSKYGVTVISDEIHCDIVEPGRSYVPFISASETCAEISVNCYAPSKTFNIAGLQSACLAIKNPVLRHRMWRAVNTDEVGEPNVFAVNANIAAYNECDDWCDEMIEYVFENRRVCEEFIRERLPMLRLSHAEATYLLWVDISAVSNDSGAFAAMLREKTGLYVSCGEVYGANGSSFLRINIATQRSRVLDGLSRLERMLTEK